MKTESLVGKMPANRVSDVMVSSSRQMREDEKGALSSSLWVGGNKTSGAFTGIGEINVSGAIEGKREDQIS
jgi:hypothetical protein